MSPRQGRSRGQGRLPSRFRIAALILVLALIATLGVLHRVSAAGEDRLFNRLGDVPPTRVALVLGCPPVLAGGHANAYFEGRVKAAAALFHAGKVEYLLVSGDNGTVRYNEPKAMTEALLQRAVPESRIVADYAGFRTLDSIVRAKEVFGQQRVVVVSQEFHNRRALFLADHIGLQAHAYNAQDVERGWLARLRWRETAARLKAAADAYLLGMEPKFLGEPVVIGGATESRAESTESIERTTNTESTTNTENTEVVPEAPVTDRGTSTVQFAADGSDPRDDAPP